jgi:hypothetical protein
VTAWLAARLRGLPQAAFSFISACSHDAGWLTSAYGIALHQSPQECPRLPGKILSGCLILWYGLRALGIEEPYWAMISLIIVTEPDMTVAKANFRARLINTISGCIVSCIALVIFGRPSWPCWWP